jgi:hypothetical protein
MAGEACAGLWVSADLGNCYPRVSPVLAAVVWQ